MKPVNYYKLGLSLSIINFGSKNLKEFQENKDNFSEFYNKSNDNQNTSEINSTLLINEKFVPKIVLESLKRILDILKEEDLSEKTRHEIESIITKMENNFKNYRYSTIVDDFQLWTERIMTEIENTTVPLLTSNELIRNRFLSDKLENILSDKEISFLSESEKSDLLDCVNCILTKNFTPSGMIAMRLVESMARQYYFKITGKKVEKKNWGDLIKELLNRKDVNRPLLGYFEYLKSIRNKLAHPEERLDLNQSEQTFNHTISIIIELKKELK